MQIDLATVKKDIKMLTIYENEIKCLKNLIEDIAMKNKANFLKLWS